MLTWRPVVPGSDLHLDLLSRSLTARERLGAVLYPDLHHRRACALMAAAAGRVATKQETPALVARGASVPITNESRVRGDGCSTECA